MRGTLATENKATSNPATVGHQLLARAKWDTRDTDVSYEDASTRIRQSYTFYNRDLNTMQ